MIVSGTNIDIIIERWEQMIMVLKNLDAHARIHHWNMSIWSQKTSCGTVACAAGHCAMDPWFNAQGLFLRYSPLTGDGVLSISPFDFWDDRGVMDILINSRPRDIDTVIEEVTAHLSHLQRAKLRFNQ